jgi:uncharacterized membrane protein YgcG
MAQRRPELPEDWFHRHPHLTTLGAGVVASVFFAAMFAAGGTTGISLAIAAGLAGAAMVALAELASFAFRLPLVPYLLTGDGLGDYRYTEAGAGPHLGVWGGGGDCGGGGDGGGG